MQIEINDKEKTALSILFGLNQKFAREEPKTYSSEELHRMFSELIKKINKKELVYCETSLEVVKKYSKVWGVVEEAVDRSKIRRFDWSIIFGRSLTQEILFIKKENYDVEETFGIIVNDERVKKFIEENPREKRKILENLKISIHARYGENNTAKKVMESGQ